MVRPEPIYKPEKKDTNLDAYFQETIQKAKFTVSCAREPFTVWDQYDVIRYCEDEKEVSEAVSSYIRCGYEIIDVRPFKF